VAIQVTSQKIEIKHQKLAKKGGQSSGGNFKNDREKASEAGKKGGQNSKRS